jgi:hypothetical protein
MEGIGEKQVDPAAWVAWADPPNRCRDSKTIAVAVLGNNLIVTVRPWNLQCVK